MANFWHVLQKIKSEKEVNMYIDAQSEHDVRTGEKLFGKGPFAGLTIHRQPENDLGAGITMVIQYFKTKTPGVEKRVKLFKYSSETSFRRTLPYWHIQLPPKNG